MARRVYMTMMEINNKVNPIRDTVIAQQATIQQLGTDVYNLNINKADNIHTHSFNNITNRPATYPADWGNISNKPTFFSGNYNDLTNKPTIPSIVQADWNQTNTSSPDFIKNKPTESYLTPDRALNASFQVNSSKPSLVRYSVQITTSATLVLGSRGTVYLRYADDAAFTQNIKEVDKQGFGIPTGIVSSGISTVSVGGKIPAGKYVRIITENTMGTPSFSIQNPSYEVLQ